MVNDSNALKRRNLNGLLKLCNELRANLRCYKNKLSKKYRLAKASLIKKINRLEIQVVARLTRTKVMPDAAN